MDAAVLNEITVGLYQYVGILLCILGNLGNIFCALIFFQKTWRKNVCVFYFLVCVLLDSIYINISILGTVFILGFHIPVTDANVALCKIYNYLTLLLSTLSSTILILASIDRLLISSQNIDTRLYSSRRLAYLLIGTSSILWSIFFLHVPIKFDIQQTGLFVSLCLFNTMESYATFVTYSTLILTIVSFLIMIILSILSFQNVRRIRSIPRRQRQVGRTMHKKDFQLLRCLFAKDITFISCDILLCGYLIYKFIPKSEARTTQEQPFTTFVFNLSALIHHIPFCASFYIYIVISKAFRQSFQRLLWKMLGKDIVITREESNEIAVVNTIAS